VPFLSCDALELQAAMSAPASAMASNQVFMFAAAVRTARAAQNGSRSETQKVSSLDQPPARLQRPLVARRPSEFDRDGRPEIVYTNGDEEMLP
jgi:hypothetical protein